MSVKMEEMMDDIWLVVITFEQRCYTVVEPSKILVIRFKGFACAV